MKKLFVFLGIAVTAVGSALSAQEVDSMVPLQKSSWGDANESEITDYIPDICLDTRFGYSHDITENAGRFGGNGLFLDINGYISPHFSYSLNHRLANFEGMDEPGFGNTNWLTLTYETDDFYISAGKEDIKIGSFEYEAYDLDCYWEMNSLFWNCCSPWQWGVSGGWYPAEGQTVLGQISNSPYSYFETYNLQAYALAWRGEWDCYESYWSANMWEYDNGKFVKSLNLGNMFYFGDFSINLDYMARAKDMNKFFTSDFTLLVSPAYEWEWGRAFAKIGWEKVEEDNFGYEFTGSNIFYGAGAEFFPLKEQKDIRLHVIWGSNSQLTGAHLIDIGLTWKFNLTEAGKRLLNKIQK